MRNELSTKPPKQVELDQRYEQANTDEELEQLVEEQEQLDTERRQILGHGATELVIGPGGVAVDKSLLDKERAAGHDIDGPYNHGQR